MNLKRSRFVEIMLRDTIMENLFLSYYDTFGFFGLLSHILEGDLAF